MQKCRNPHPLASNLLGLRIRLLIASTAQSLSSLRQGLICSNGIYRVHCVWRLEVMQIQLGQSVLFHVD
jgi:hypothetical protein